MQHRNVGAAQPAVSASEQYNGERTVAPAFPCILSGGAGRGTSVSGRDRFDDVAWGGLAVHPTGTLRGTHRRTGAVDRHSLWAPAASARSGGGERRISRVGGPAEVVRSFRGLLQDVYG